MISRFIPTIDRLDTSINKKKDAELRGTRNQFLDSQNLLVLLSLADILAEVNRSSKIFQQRPLIFANNNIRLRILITNLQQIQQNDSSLIKERMELARGTCGNNLLEVKGDFNDKI